MSLLRYEHLLLDFKEFMKEFIIKGRPFLSQLKHRDRKKRAQGTKQVQCQRMQKNIEEIELNQYNLLIKPVTFQLALVLTSERFLFLVTYFRFKPCLFNWIVFRNRYFQGKTFLKI